MERRTRLPLQEAAAAAVWQQCDKQQAANVWHVRDAGSRWSKPHTTGVVNKSAACLLPGKCHTTRPECHIKTSEPTTAIQAYMQAMHRMQGPDPFFPTAHHAVHLHTCVL